MLFIAVCNAIYSCLTFYNPLTKNKTIIFYCLFITGSYNSKNYYNKNYCMRFNMQINILEKNLSSLSLNNL